MKVRDRRTQLIAAGAALVLMVAGFALTWSDPETRRTAATPKRTTTSVTTATTTSATVVAAPATPASHASRIWLGRPSARSSG